MYIGVEGREPRGAPRPYARRGTGRGRRGPRGGGPEGPPGPLGLSCPPRSSLAILSRSRQGLFDLGRARASDSGRANQSASAPRALPDSQGAILSSSWPDLLGGSTQGCCSPIGSPATPNADTTNGRIRHLRPNEIGLFITNSLTPSHACKLHASDRNYTSIIQILHSFYIHFSSSSSSSSFYYKIPTKLTANAN
jgi:hypothetical protein